MQRVRFIHTADLHLGRTFPYEDQDFLARGYADRFSTFQKILEICREKAATYLFFVGDIFEQGDFTRSQGLRFIQALENLECRKIFFLLGNHDYRLKYYLEENKPDKLFLFPSDQLGIYDDEEAEIRFLGQSWAKADQNYSLQIEKKDFRPGYRHILLHHGTWMGQSYFPLNLKKDILDRLDYIGLGHIHKPEKYGSKAFMVGTPEIMSHKDKGDRGIILGELDQDLRTIFLPTSRRKIREEVILIEEEEDLGQILNKTRKIFSSKEDLYHLTLKGRPLAERDLETLSYLIKEEGVYAYFTDETQRLENLADLYARHYDDIIGEFIRKLDTWDLDDQMKQKVAEIGIRALLAGGHDD